jgi:excisionase family DNA binding protein
MGRTMDHPTDRLDIPTRLEQSRDAITVPQLARMLALSPKTIYEMTAAGNIPYYRVRGSIRYDGVHVAQWLREQEA